MTGEPIRRGHRSGPWFAALGVCLLVAGVLARFASDQPDGLARVAADHGIAETAVTAAGPLDAGHTAGVLLGLGIVLLLTTGLAWALRRRPAPVSGEAPKSPAAQCDPPAHGR